jgi:5'(3')-deoxyribonucleotidase
MDKKLRIGIDMDEVIADTIQKFVDIYKLNHGFDILTHQMEGKEIGDMLPAELNALKRTYINQPGFFRDIPVIAGSQPVVKELCEKYDVYIVSAAMEFKNSLLDKYEWLAEHFPYISWTNIIFCGYKIVNVDVLIDDRIKNFVNFDGRKLLYTSPHNLLINDYERVNNWQDVANILL